MMKGLLVMICLLSVFSIYTCFGAENEFNPVLFEGGGFSPQDLSLPLFAPDGYPWSGFQSTPFESNSPSPVMDPFSPGSFFVSSENGTSQRSPDNPLNALLGDDDWIIWFAAQQGYFSYPQGITLTELAAKTGKTESELREILDRDDLRLPTRVMTHYPYLPPGMM